VSFLKRWVRHAQHASSRSRTRLNVEVLESRLTPYVTSGSAWLSPQLITISFVPDGTDLGGVSSDLFATFNGHPGWSTSTWQNQILKGAQQWAAQTNINFAVVSDNGAAIGDGNYQQGDPNMGDIRIGGYDFGTSDLAGAYLPNPLNNYSIAGDIQFNTGQSFNIGSTYDLFSVTMHEIGHALGLYHTTVSGNVMQGFYQMRSGLGSDDIAGIRNIYSSNNARSQDSYDAGGSDGSFATAANLNSLISGTTALVTGLDMTTTSDPDYFTFTAPSDTTGTLTVKAQSAGLSLLAPTLRVYNSSQQQIGYASGAGQYGTTVTVTVTGISAGQQFYAKVVGADTSAFGTGAYALTLNFGSGHSPTVPLPNTQHLNGNPLQSSGGIAQKPGVDSQAAATLSVLGQRVDGPWFAVTPQGVTAPASATGTVAPLSVAAPVRASQISNVDSGGGGNLADEGIEDVTSQTPVELAMDGTASWLLNPAIESGQTLQVKPDSRAWREASGACFALENAAPRVADAQELNGSLGGDAQALLDPGAAAVCLAVVLGSSWHVRPEENCFRQRKPH
jgi:hypothetical protein